MDAISNKVDRLSDKVDRLSEELKEHGKNVPELSSLIERLQAYLQLQAMNPFGDGYAVPSLAAEQSDLDENLIVVTKP
jgi:predicted RNase H-like nuclease (RuvC/YqgF family)